MQKTGPNENCDMTHAIVGANGCVWGKGERVEFARVVGGVGSGGQKVIKKILEAQKKIQPKPFHG